MTWPRTVSEAVNPVTGTIVSLTPPFTAGSAEDLARFRADFASYCAAGWSLGQHDPHEIALTAA